MRRPSTAPGAGLLPARPPFWRRLLRPELLPVLIPAVLLTLLGLLLIRSASTRYVVAFHMIQLKWVGIGLLAMVPVALIPYPRLVRLAPAGYLLGVAALVLVKLVAPTVNGSQRWLILGGQRLQPSELMKVAMILLLARLLRFGRPVTGFTDWAVPLVLAGLPMGLIVMQPDLGTGMLFVPLVLCALWVSGLRLRTLSMLLVLGGLLGTLTYGFLLKPYQQERIRSTFQYAGMSPSQLASEAYQLHQSLIAVGNGGAFGFGHGEGPRIQGGHLPYRQNDFVFAVLAEEHGFLGCSLALFVLLALVYGIFSIARRTRDPSGRIIVVAVGTLFFAQAAIHTGVVLGVVPTTGMPFPFVSYGGSGLLSSMVAIALVINVALNRPNTLIRTTRSEGY